MTQIQQALHELFKRHRVVLWYDDKREFRGEFENLLIPGVELIELSINNKHAGPPESKRLRTTKSCWS